MAFKIFPAWLTPDGRKVPLIKDWQELATTDPDQIALWQEIYRDRIAFWAIPCGPANGILALDVDVKNHNGFETLKDFQMPQTLSQRTPSGGAHYLFNYPNDGNHYGNKVKFLPGLDTRGTGGWIASYGLDNTPMCDAPVWLLDGVAKVAYVQDGEIIKVSPEIAQATINESLEAIREAPKEEGNDILNLESFKLGQLVASGSISREYAEGVLYQAAIERGRPEIEARKTIESGLNGGDKKPMTSPFGKPEPEFYIPPPPLTERWTPEYFRMDDLFNTQHLRKPQLFEHWSTEDIHITTADGGTGKTTLKLFEAICLALGDRFLGFNNVCGPAKTLFITGEDTALKLGAMIGAIARQMGISNDQDKMNVILSSIVVKKDSDLCIISKDRQGFLHMNNKAMDSVLEAVYDIKPKMIVFDPISAFWGSEAALNDMAKAVSKFMAKLVTESNACVEMINHMGKASSANKDMTQFASRGGSGLPSQARVCRVFRSIDEEEYRELTNDDLEENQSVMMCNVNKFTDGSPLYNNEFLIVRQGYAFRPQQIQPQTKREKEMRDSDVQRCMDYVKEIRESGRYPTRNIVIGYFMTCGDKISEARTKRALTMLAFTGCDGEKVMLIENPDVSVTDKAFVITDMHGKEI